MSKDEEHLNSPSEPEEPDRKPAPPETNPAEPSSGASEPEPKAGADEPIRETTEEPEVLYEPPPATDTRPANKTRSSFSPVLGLLVLLMLALGGGTVYIYQEQQKFQKAALARLDQMESTLNSIHTDASRTEANSQQLQALKAELDRFKQQVSRTLQSHQNTLSTMDEDILRLKEAVSGLHQPMDAESEDKTEKPGASSEVSHEPETGEPGTAVQQESPKRPEETQKYIDFVETTTEKFFRLLKEGIIKLWEYFVSLFD